MKTQQVLGLLCVGALLGCVFLLTIGRWRPCTEVSFKSKPETAAQTATGRKWPSKLASELSFIPLHFTQCSEIFTAANPLVLPIEITNAIEKLNVELKKIPIREVVESYAVLFPEKPVVHLRLLRMPFIRTVCETGFNAGHSTLTWLLGNPNVTVYSFDLGMHEYGRPMADYLSKLFPGRLTVTWGDSTVTLPKFHKEFPNVVCDLISIDGGHTDSIARQDFDNFKAMASCDNVLIYDDYPLNVPDLGPTWEGKKRSGEVTEFFKCDIRSWGFSVGRYLLEKCAN